MCWCLHLDAFTKCLIVHAPNFLYTYLRSTIHVPVFFHQFIVAIGSFSRNWIKKEGIRLFLKKNLDCFRMLDPIRNSREQFISSWILNNHIWSIVHENNNHWVLKFLMHLIEMTIPSFSPSENWEQRARLEVTPNWPLAQQTKSHKYFRTVPWSSNWRYIATLFLSSSHQYNDLSLSSLNLR